MGLVRRERGWFRSCSHTSPSKCLSKRRARGGRGGTGGARSRGPGWAVPQGGVWAARASSLDHERVCGCRGICEVPPVLGGKDQHRQSAPKPHSGMGPWCCLCTALTTAGGSGPPTPPPAHGNRGHIPDG